MFRLLYNDSGRPIDRSVELNFKSKFRVFYIRVLSAIVIFVDVFGRLWMISLFGISSNESLSLM